MQASQLKPAGSFALNYGVKAIVFGPPGSGKTPLVETAPNPVMMISEPGALSIRGSKVPTWAGLDVKTISEFFDWLAKSAEPKRFDTVFIDSWSQVAEVVLADELSRAKDPRKAFGELSRTVMGWANQLFFMPQKHVVLLAKETRFEEMGMTPNAMGIMAPTVLSSKRAPYFPGQDLNVKMPHLYDEILQLTRGSVPGVVGEQRHFRCQPSATLATRDRSGRLSDFEPPDLAHIFKKCMSA